MSHVKAIAAVGIAGVVVVGLAAALNRSHMSSVGDAPASKAGKIEVAQISTWRSFISPAELAARLEDPKTLVIDVRKAEAYAKGHIPGSISLPGDEWRTPNCRPGAGDSQYIFRTDDAAPDIARYEAFLGAAGVSRDHRIVVVGEHAGKADGSTPAMILHWLGHEDVVFLDGVGTDRWVAEGRTLATEARRLPATTYAAKADPAVIWNLDRVLASIGDDSVVFLDTRSLDEYNGLDRRNNRYGGRIPGAIRFDYYDLLASDKTTVSPARAHSMLTERGITPEHTIVLYCQTATRVSLTYLALKDLGFDRIAIYDASWHEYGNRDDTPIEGKTVASAG